MSQGPHPKPKIQNRMAQQYQRAQIETASPTRLILMLYDGAIRFCSLAIDAMAQQHFEEQSNYLVKAQRILGELMSSLNREAGGELASNLMHVYVHMLEQLVNANIYDQTEPVQAVIEELRELRGAWAEVDRQTAAGTEATQNAKPKSQPLGDRHA